MAEESINGNGSGNGHTPADLAPHAASIAELRSLMDQIRNLEGNVILSRSAWGRQHGVSFGGARDEYSVLGYDDIITSEQYRIEYERGGLAGRVVDVMPDATWRGELPFELIEDENPEVTTEFEKAWTALEKKHQINAKLHRVDKLSRLSTYAVLLIGAGGDWSTPLPTARKGIDSLLYLMPFLGGGGPGGRNAKTSAAGADANIFEYETDSNSPRFGLPKSYTLKRTDIAAMDWGRAVHYTRIVHIAENLLDDEVFGQPALERIWNLLADLRKVTGGGAEAFWLRANQGLHLDIDKDMQQSDVAGTVAALKEQAEAYKHQLTRWLRTRGVEVQTLGSDVANFEAPADAIITQIAGSKGIPKRILTGSEMGELASSQDRENFRDLIIGRQTQYAGPYIVKPLVDRLIEYGYLPTPQKETGYTVKWPHIQVLTEDEKATGGLQWSQTKIGEDPVFTDSEIRDHFHGLPPLSDEQRQEINDRKDEAVKRQQEAMAAKNPPPGSGDAKKAPPEDEEKGAKKMKLIGELKAAQAGKTRKFSSTQIQLPPVLAENLLAFGKSLPAFDLCDEEGGLEDDAHITVKYGLHTNNPADVRKALATYVGPVRFTLGKTNIFEADDYDVLYVEVESPDLVALNQRFSDRLEVTTTHPVYTPHATVAYLKKGLGIRYVGLTTMEGMSASVGTVRFSPAEGYDVDIRITGRGETGAFARVDERYAGDFEGHPFRGNQWTLTHPHRAPWEPKHPDREREFDAAKAYAEHYRKTGGHAESRPSAEQATKLHDAYQQIEQWLTDPDIGMEIYNTLTGSSGTVDSIRKRLYELETGSAAVVGGMGGRLPVDRLRMPPRRPLRAAAGVNLATSEGKAIVALRRLLELLEDPDTADFVRQLAEDADEEFGLRAAVDFETLGDFEGHPFRGNQYTEGNASGRTDRELQEEAKGYPEGAIVVKSKYGEVQVKHGADGVTRFRGYRKNGQAEPEKTTLREAKETLRGPREEDRDRFRSGWLAPDVAWKEPTAERIERSRRDRTDAQRREQQHRPGPSGDVDAWAEEQRRERERASMRRRRHLEDGEPLESAEDFELIRVLTAAIQAGDHETVLKVLGGPGSGNFGHAGRPGQVGGSAPDGEDGSDAAALDRIINRPSSAYPKSRPEGTESKEQYRLPNGDYTPERRALHEAIVERHFIGKTPVKNPEAIVLGGGPASGKSTLEHAEGLSKGNKVLINPDAIKEMLPEYHEMKNDPTVSSFVHEESSDVAKLLTSRAAERGYNIVLDGTGDSKVEKLGGKIAVMREAGHTIIGKYVTLPTDLAVKLSKDRADKLERAGKVRREVPESYLRETHAQVSNTFAAALRQGLFDKADLYDTTIQGNMRKVVSAEGKNVKVYDYGLWETFLNKGKEKP